MNWIQVLFPVLIQTPLGMISPAIRQRIGFIIFMGLHAVAAR